MITILGTTVVDRVFYLPSKLNPGGKQAAQEQREEIGGNAFNVWRTALALGGSCRLITVVGKDSEGDSVARACSIGKENVLLRRDKGLTVTSTVIVGDGDRTCISSPHATRVEGVSAKDVDEVTLGEDGGRIVVSDGRYIAATIRLIERGASILGDFEWRESMAYDGQDKARRELLGGVEWAKIDSEFVERVYNNDIGALLDVAKSAGWVVVTNGSEGSVLYEKGEPWKATKVGAVKLDTVIDSTGAGDGFVAGLAYCIYKGHENPVNCVRFASAVGAIVCQKKGGYLEEGAEVHGETEIEVHGETEIELEVISRK